MIVLIGDIHGEFEVLKNIVDNIPKNALIIQLGDFGYWPSLANKWNEVGIDRLILFIDGNHDYVPKLLETGSQWTNAYYLRRGTVIEHDGYRIMCMGGSKSVDRAWRTKDSLNHGWFEEEQVTKQDIEQAIIGNDNKPVDFLLTHTPPDFVIRENFSPNGLLMFGHNPSTWVDESAVLIETLRNSLYNSNGEHPITISGHMHKSITYGDCVILNIGEVFTIG